MRYFWSLMSSDNGHRFLGKKPHIFAAFFELNERNDKVREFCISWLPDQGPYKIFGKAVKGKNWSLNETLFQTPSEALPIQVRGPVEVEQKFFERAVQWRDKLENGEIQYKVLDWGRKDCRNCTSSLAELDDKRKFVVGTKAGHEAADALWGFYAESFVQTKVEYQIEDCFDELKNFKFWKKVI